MELFFVIFPMLFSVVFLFVLGVIVYTLVSNVKRERHNDRSPRLTVAAKVVAKRTDFHRSSGTQHQMGHGHATYFVTFEVESGDRMELNLSGADYGMLVEGDWGELTFQGTRYLGFQRKVKTHDL